MAWVEDKIHRSHSNDIQAQLECYGLSKSVMLSQIAVN